ncbi:tenascin [Drosophila miranda]|uniref:tenascin n=1 Tax=Drosophila miranda TaxID=7229 RepID=UPI0007E6B786|nr:tenascin [Drosophila miranda]
MKSHQVRMFYHVCSLWTLLCLMPWPSLAAMSRDSSNCMEGSVEADPQDCASYFQCLDSVILHQQCPAGAYYEASYQVCVIDDKGICSPASNKCIEGELTEDPADCAGYLQCIDGDFVKQKCAPGSYFNLISKICLVDGNVSCSPQQERCNDGELSGDPEDCARYLQCVNGVLVKERCNKGSYFDVNLNMCIVDVDGVCVSSENCTEGELESDPNDCAGYLKCIDGYLEEQQCSSGSYFNSSLKICLVDVNGICVAPPANCTEGELDVDPNDCAGYLKCINGQFVEEQCPSGSYFDAKMELCLIDVDGICLPTVRKCTEGYMEEDPEDCAGYRQCISQELVQLKCDPGSYFNATESSCLIDQDEVCVSLVERCSEGELMQDAANCGGFLICVDGLFVAKNCGSGEYFHPGVQECLEDDQNICHSKCRCVSSAKGRCVEGKRVADPQDCGAYLECIDGQLVEQICSGGTYFETTIGGCVIDEKHFCVDGERKEE